MILTAANISITSKTAKVVCYSAGVDQESNGVTVRFLHICKICDKEMFSHTEALRDSVGTGQMQFIRGTAYESGRGWPQPWIYQRCPPSDRRRKI